MDLIYNTEKKAYVGKAYIGIKYVADKWDIRLEESPFEDSATALTHDEANVKAIKMANSHDCNIIRKSIINDDGEIIQLSPPD